MTELRAKRPKREWLGLVFILPWIIGFLIFQLYPFVTSFYYSLTRYSIVEEPVFIGFKNYVDLFTIDQDFYKSAKATILYVLMEVPGRMIISLFIAMLLNMKVKFLGFFRTVYYLPSILGGSVALSVVWRALFYTNGTINRLLGIIGIPSVDWLGNPNIAIYTLGLLSIWQFGSPMIIFLSGLKNIPEEIYEAARIEGASPARTFVSITMPMLSPIILYNIVMQTISAFQSFTGAFVVTNGGPLKSTYLLVLKLYQEAFAFFKMGYASAISWVLFAAIMVITLAIFATSKRWVFYADTPDGR